MEEFLKQNYLLITYSVEFLAAVIGILHYDKYKRTAAKFLIYFLIYGFLIDVFGNYPQHLKRLDLFYLIEGTLIETNYWVSNILWFTGLVSLLCYINYKILEKSHFRRIIKYFFLVYLVLLLLHCILNIDLIFTMLNSFVAILSLWIVFVCTSMYYVEILQSKIVLQFYKSIFFYINSCILLWSIIVVPLVFYEIYFSTADWDFIILKWQIFLFMNISFYTTLALALIFCKPEIK